MVFRGRLATELRPYNETMDHGMKLAAFEGVVDNDAVRLPSHVHLPNRTRVFVVVPEAEGRRTAAVLSPRLAHPEQASDFKKEILEESSDAGV